MHSAESCTCFSLWWRLQSSAVIESVWCVYLNSFFPEVTCCIFPLHIVIRFWTFNISVNLNIYWGVGGVLHCVRCRCLQYHVSRLQQPPELGAEIARKPAVWVPRLQCCSAAVCRVNHLQGENISLDWHTSTPTHFYSCRSSASPYFRKFQCQNWGILLEHAFVVNKN